MNACKIILDNGDVRYSVGDTLSTLISFEEWEELEILYKQKLDCVPLNIRNKAWVIYHIEKIVSPVMLQAFITKILLTNG